ncbi:Methionyl-tRNA formyltransferase [Yamadazyma tenuis]|uniref:methionyl-tRNA formyltransferase n=1 Tax=Candida tenuis (strain ATCC 10573 / BCRC 21748 / CBS 615 / JCM 9827 / NBRC 10315 / NRRL Y-1498 / VKM Y-70) TaxID=590646 RepID=G3B4K6_CANTC|nr:Formyltransferase [Yamadazyma tenuis ATCC 10573]EGV63968.1 Formyltransferase [Yamadazyma tenuis ATCC 10573]WEJ96415.1 Methionyl-tRNA formyltransferase [Yamadazyma tenuis]
MVIKPLQIAFFGSDRFSVAALDHVLRLKAHTPLIESVHVITRSIKPKGRKLVTYEDLPVGLFAASNGVSVLRADSPSEINRLLDQFRFNLAVAVSYGQLIPSHFISAMQFGGLNVHPSLLPKYSGSSPIHYALINDDKFTGVSVQTLHPTKFDRGDILLQSQPVEIQDTDNYTSLESKLGDIGGEALTQVLNQGLYRETKPLVPQTKYSTAFKINTSMAQVKWDQTSRQIRRLGDALGPLHTYVRCNPSKKLNSKSPVYKRVILEDLKEIDNGVYAELGVFSLDRATNTITAGTGDGALSIGSLTFECCKAEDANSFYKRFPKRTNKADFQFTVVA